eukprot:CAMPEP_0170517504 /NCGR_PEP_ID=MMETSP0209-20121228/3477_1 /TAXON_ID=665100 ORGANISM="Litonotus pictus, Strain P1" /NCGR_SAMPLE_ID=MMETSP0209 /ASSEMBLY_ACC=CAM_ASM_000301 /LENGTH=178 /DNA_ID=CAMNT_0010802775 /DNA_START=8 /DNA_END=544 /DNA_ORIENTATION=-
MEFRIRTVNIFFILILISSIKCIQVKKVHSSDPKFHVYSSDVENEKRIPDKFTPQGEDVAPQIYWENSPSETVSFAFVNYDTDASPLFTHYVLVNIPSNVNNLKDALANSSSEEITNSWGFKHYMGPKPPVGKPHHYHYRVYALSTLIRETTLEKVQEEIEKNTLASDEVIGIYELFN